MQSTAGEGASVWGKVAKGVPTRQEHLNGRRIGWESGRVKVVTLPARSANSPRAHRRTVWNACRSAATGRCGRSAPLRCRCRTGASGGPPSCKTAHTHKDNEFNVSNQNQNETESNYDQSRGPFSFRRPRLEIRENTADVRDRQASADKDEIDDKG
eukprot:693733-Prorocentrum_minimum.AAC.1